MQERRTERGLYPAFRVDLARVELASCIGSTTASTCVVHRLMSPTAGWWTTHRWMSSLKFRHVP